MSKHDLTKLAQQMPDPDDIADALDEEARCRSTRIAVPKDTSGTKSDRARARKRRKEDVRRAREEKEKWASLEPRSPRE